MPWKSFFCSFSVSKTNCERRAAWCGPAFVQRQLSQGCCRRRGDANLTRNVLRYGEINCTANSTHFCGCFGWFWGGARNATTLGASPSDQDHCVFTGDLYFCLAAAINRPKTLLFYPAEKSFLLETQFEMEIRFNDLGTQNLRSLAIN